MNKLDEDISEGFKKIKAFKKKVKENGFKRGKGNIKLFEEKGFEIPEAKKTSRLHKEYIHFNMYEIWKKYGSDIVFRCNYWNRPSFVLLLGIYSTKDIQNSKYLSNHQKRNLMIKRKKGDIRIRNFIYLHNNINNYVKINTTTKTDTWSEYNEKGSKNRVLGYRLKPENSFMNWNNPPI